MRLLTALAALLVLALAGCATSAPQGSDGFIRELAVFDDGFAQGGVPARTMTVRMACAHNYDPSSVYRLCLDVDGDGKADHRIETRCRDGKWTTEGGPTGTVGGSPGNGNEAVFWRVPVSAIGLARNSLMLWVEADTPSGLHRAPAGRSQLHAVGRPDWPNNAFEPPRAD